MSSQTVMSKSSSPVAGAARIFDLSLGELLWSRRTIFMALVVGAPVLLATVARIVQASGVAPLRVNGSRVDAVSIFGMIIWVLFLRFIVPVLGVFYGTSLVADEVEDKTITYLFTRPLRRGAVLLGKYLAYLACTTLVVLPSVMIVYFMLVPFGEIPRSFHRVDDRPGTPGRRHRHIRGAVHLRRGLAEEATRRRADLCVRVGTVRDADAGLPSPVHACLLPAGAGTSCDAGR
jgi:hypothetical protein